MYTEGWFILLILSMFCEYGQAVTLYKPFHMVSQTVVVFQSNISLLTSSDFTISLNANFTRSPLISYGLNHYRMSDRMYYENIKTLITSINPTSFSLSVILIQSTKLYKCSISYLASQDTRYVLMWSKSYLNPNNVSKGKGIRSINLVQTYNFTTLEVSGTFFISGFYLQSIKEYYVKATLQGITPNNYTVRLSTQSDCTISRIDISFFFYYQAIIAEYSISIQNFACFYNINYQNTISTITNVGNSIFMLGMMGFSGLVIKSILDLGWQIISNTGNDSIITINTNNLDYLCYNFIQISSLNPPPLPNNTVINDKMQESGSIDSNLIIIIAVPVSIITVVIVIILLVRRWWKKKYFDAKQLKQSKKNLSLANLNELPSINF